MHYSHLYTTEQAYYLEYLDVSDGAEEIEPCDDGCSSSEIALPFNFPFGNYYHRSAYVRQTHRKKCAKCSACVFNPRRACARVTVVVCLSVYPSVPALAASASVETSKQRYSRVSLRLFFD